MADAFLVVMVLMCSCSMFSVGYLYAWICVRHNVLQNEKQFSEAYKRLDGLIERAGKAAMELYDKCSDEDGDECDDNYKEYPSEFWRYN